MLRRRFIWLLFGTAVSLLMVGGMLPLLASAQPRPLETSSPADRPTFDSPLEQTQTAVIEAALLSQMEAGDVDQVIRFIVHMKQSADLRQATLPAARLARHTAVIARLQQTAAASQAPLLKEMESMRSAGAIRKVQPFWVFNGIGASGTAAAIRQIARNPAVARISLDAAHQYFDPPSTAPQLGQFLQATAVTTTTAASWGIERIGAPYVWDALEVDGQGVTIAIVDSGVDWLHPDLNANYRGNLGGGVVDHNGNWYHTSIPTITEPVDVLGHGTHVAGTAVGQNGIGVAPGAKWIAVSIADANGLIFDSDVHLAFQWLMAPAGDPALAPDIANNSWGGSPYLTTFLKDVTALQAAGIVTVFAAGNTGPGPETINSPGSYTDTLAVGASDDLDAVAWFSSRGPSPLTAETKPWVTAPGTHIYSALPDGKHGFGNGTSMATPHVAGAIALLLSANPALSRQEVTQLLADTAVPISNVHPNDDSGWGRIDAYAAVSTQVITGALVGTIRHNGAPLPFVSVTITTPAGTPLKYQTDGSGRYLAVLQPAVYALAAAPFGYVPTYTTGISVSAGLTTVQDLDLSRLPGGSVQGTVRDAGTLLPLAATLSVSSAPISVTTDVDGRYALQLPSNVYTLTVRAAGHRLGQAAITVTLNQTVTQDFNLAQGPNVLLVDSGQWYYSSYATYYQAALDSTFNNHDLWSIRDPFNDVPTAADLQIYDIVIWSSPADSPGFLGANNVITDYLGTGGNLLISGQDVASYDGYGFGTQVWFYRDLEALFMGSTAPTRTITGAVGSVFEGLSFTMNQGDSAANQVAPDFTQPKTDSLSTAVLYYDTGQIAGLQAGHCDPFRIVFLGVGLEGISDAADRAAVLGRSFDYFQAQPIQTGMRWLPDSVNDFSLKGNRLVYTFTLQNLSETVTDTFTLNLSGGSWPTAIMTQTLTLGACQQGQTVLTIDVPADAPDDFTHVMTLTAVSGNNPSVIQAFPLRHKTPGKILLVDDDRWYDRELEFQAALDGAGLSYDVWETGYNLKGRGSPLAAYLNAYDIIIWYTGYDWFEPVTTGENAALTSYLAQGGRLFLTSQDFLYYHHQTELAQKYLGVVDFQESVTPTQVFGGDVPLLPAALETPLPLSYGPYQNFSDGMVFGPMSRPFLWHDQGTPAAVATDGGTWRSLFWGIPFETLPPLSHTAAMRAAVGWLGDLGDSTFAVDQPVTAAGVTNTYTITLRNLDRGISNSVRMTNTLPAALAVFTNTLSGGAVYDAAAHQIRWTGVMSSGQAHVVSYQAMPSSALAPGTRLDNEVTIYYQRHHLAFDRTATIWVGTPDLSASSLSAAPDTPLSAHRVTYTLRLNNTGLTATNGISALIHLPPALTAVTNTLTTTVGAVMWGGGRAIWQGSLAPSETIAVSVVMTRAVAIDPLWVLAAAEIHDGTTRTLVRETTLFLLPNTYFLPIVARP